MSVLIAGAGPTGLAAALFCCRGGIDVRIVDRQTAPSNLSKAFGVNPRTLELLEDTGVTERFLANGWKMRALNMWVQGRHVVRNDLKGLHDRFDFMLIQAQADSERIMAEVLEESGIQVERGLSVETVVSDNDAGTVCVTLSRENGAQETVRTRYLFGADGSQSTVRDQVGITFDGLDAQEPWLLYDVELDETSLAEEEVHIMMLADGAMFMVRIRDNIWRILGNVPDLLNRLPGGSKAGKVHWTSEFGIAAKIASSFEAHGRVFLGGDAAHIHSGLGARGMNLGIEDAWIFADRLAAGALSSYGADRRRIVVPLMKRIHRMTDIMRGRSMLAKQARWLIPTVGRLVLPLALPTLGRFVLGLDHDVNRLAQTASP